MDKDTTKPLTNTDRTQSRVSEDHASVHLNPSSSIHNVQPSTSTPISESKSIETEKGANEVLRNTGRTPSEVSEIRVPAHPISAIHNKQLSTSTPISESTIIGIEKNPGKAVKTPDKTPSPASEIHVSAHQIAEIDDGQQFTQMPESPKHESYFQPNSSNAKVAAKDHEDESEEDDEDVTLAQPVLKPKLNYYEHEKVDKACCWSLKRKSDHQVQHNQIRYVSPKREKKIICKHPHKTPNVKLPNKKLDNQDKSKPGKVKVEPDFTYNNRDIILLRELRDRLNRKNELWGSEVIMAYDKSLPKRSTQDNSDVIYPTPPNASLAVQWFYYFLNMLANGMAFAFVIVVLVFLVVSIYRNYNDLSCRKHYWNVFTKACGFWIILYITQTLAGFILKMSWSPQGIFIGDGEDHSAMFSRLPDCTFRDDSKYFTNDKLATYIDDISGPHPANILINSCYEKYEELKEALQNAEENQRCNIYAMNRPRGRGEYILRGMCPQGSCSESGQKENKSGCCRN